eukprot:gene9187-16324_t
MPLLQLLQLVQVFQLVQLVQLVLVLLAQVNLKWWSKPGCKDDAIVWYMFNPGGYKWVEGKTTCVTSDEELKERLDEHVALIRAEAEVVGRVDRVQSHYLYYLMSVPYKGTVRHLNSKTFASDDGPVNYHSAIFLPGIAPEKAEDEEVKEREPE